MGKYISYLLSVYNKNTEKRNLLQFKCKRFLKLMTLLFFKVQHTKWCGKFEYKTIKKLKKCKGNSKYNRNPMHIFLLVLCEKSLTLAPASSYPYT